MTKKERLEALIAHYSEGKPTRFAKHIGVAPSTISTWLARDTFDYDLLFAKCETVSPEWLLTGNGPMLKTDASVVDKNEEKAYTSLVNPKTKEVLRDISSFPLYNIDASAGLNKLFIGDSELLGQISIPNAPRCDGAVYVIGDSMYPLLKSGDIIAYRQVHNLQSIIYGEIYLLQLENDGDLSIVVKYVKRSEKGDDYIKLVSYNKEHDPKDIPLSWIRAVARVTLTIRKLSIT
jgi:phage repressor protein C with HTH and peptisase S24 domain